VGVFVYTFVYNYSHMLGLGAKRLFLSMGVFLKNIRWMQLRAN